MTATYVRTCVRTLYVHVQTASGNNLSGLAVQFVIVHDCYAKLTGVATFQHCGMSHVHVCSHLNAHKFLEVNLILNMGAASTCLYVQVHP